MTQNSMGIGDSLLTSLLGMAVVFLVLVILNVMIKGLSFVSKVAKKGENK